MVYLALVLLFVAKFTICASRGLFRTTMPRGMAEPSAMETKTMPYPSKRVWIVGCIALAACVGLAAAGVSYSSQTAFCLSCHEMRVYQDELMLSPHAKDAQGKAIGCSQCHIPSGNLARMLGAKAWMGIKDLWVHNVEGGTDLNRAAMQPLHAGLPTMPTAAPAIRI